SAGVQGVPGRGAAGGGTGRGPACTGPPRARRLHVRAYRVGQPALRAARPLPGPGGRAPALAADGTLTEETGMDDSRRYVRVAERADRILADDRALRAYSRFVDTQLRRRRGRKVLGWLRALAR